MLRPTSNGILIQICEEATKKKGSLILPEEKKPYEIGVVVAVGSDVKQLGVGDKIYCRRYAGFPILYEEKEYIALKMEDVIAISDLAGHP